IRDGIPPPRASPIATQGPALSVPTVSVRLPAVGAVRGVGFSSGLGW
ncbi:MAG: hypothetical protein QOG68_1446, partial [Solirubrobacteraceae bacterium]|nr:hypothetical protein [Solirubrobacteraceae bacterium]